MKKLLKLAIETGPLLVFFIVNSRAGIFTGTAAFMGAIIISLVVNWTLERKLPIVPLISAVVVLVFGGLTLYLADELFIKLKPTVINGLFAAILLGGLAAGQTLLKPVFSSAFELNDRAWRTLTLRWGLFFVALAVLNEIVWRNSSTEFWISFKLFGALPLTVLFAAAQTPLILRSQPSEVSQSAD